MHWVGPAPSASAARPAEPLSRPSAAILKVLDEVARWLHSPSHSFYTAAPSTIRPTDSLALPPALPRLLPQQSQHSHGCTRCAEAEAEALFCF